MTTEDAQRLIEEALNVSQGEIRPEDTLEKLNWDSLASVSLVALVDDKVGRTLDAKVLASCKTVADVVDIVIKAA